MKVTALLPDPLLKEVRHYSKGKNLTECLVIALNEWIALRRIKELNELVQKTPLQFKSSAAQLRNFSRRGSTS